MRELYLIRHGYTAWNLERRIQGQTDVPLSPEGVAQVRRWQLPNEARRAAWYVSPLSRTRETARLLGITPVATVDALIEMDWGEWTGRRIADLRAELGETMAANERRGLDFRPSGGESPREVARRLGNWLTSLPDTGPPVGAITHKGVIRAAISLATGWDMTADHGTKLDRDGALRFNLQDRRLSIVYPGVSMIPTE